LHLVESVGTGATSSMRPIHMPTRARARRAVCAPGPRVFVPVPPVAQSLIWRAVTPTSWHRVATSCQWEADIAAYGEGLALSALNFIPPTLKEVWDKKNGISKEYIPVTREIVSFPDKSVTWTKVSLKVSQNYCRRRFWVPVCRRVIAKHWQRVAYPFRERKSGGETGEEWWEGQARLCQ